MVKVALLVRLEAKPGKESAVAKFSGKCTTARESGNYNARVVRIAPGAIHVWNF